MMGLQGTQVRRASSHSTWTRSSLSPALPSPPRSAPPRHPPEKDGSSVDPVEGVWPGAAGPHPPLHGTEHLLTAVELKRLLCPSSIHLPTECQGPQCSSVH